MNWIPYNNNERAYSETRLLNHQGNTFAFARAISDKSPDHNTYDDIYYSIANPSSDKSDDIKQSGAQSEQTPWTSFAILDFATEFRYVGMNLITNKIETTDKNGDPGTTSSIVSCSGFSAITDGVYIYIFRRGNGEFSNAMLVDRFTFDQTSGSLKHVTEVRFQRSRDQDIPETKDDTYAGTDLDGEPFLEPAFCLSLNQSNTSGFTVCLVPCSSKSYEAMWHVFAPIMSSDQVSLFSIPYSKDAVFDFESLPEQALIDLNETGFINAPALVPVKRYAITGHTADIQTTYVDSLTSCLYFQQESTIDENGEELLLKTAGELLLEGSLYQSSGGYVDFALRFMVGYEGYLAGGDISNYQGSTTVREIGLTEMAFFGSALAFNGRDSVVHINVSSGLDSQPNSRTFETWFKLDAFNDDGSSQGLATLCDTSGYNIVSIAIDSDGRLYAIVKTSDVPIYLDVSAVIPGIWMHAAVSISYNQVMLTLNAGLSTTVAADMSNSDIESINNLQFGCGWTDSSSTGYFRGQLSETRLWKCAKALSDIREMISTPVPSNDPDIQFAFDMADRRNSNSSVGVVTSYINGDNATNYAARWVSASSPSRPGTASLYTDSYMLSIGGSLVAESMTNRRVSSSGKNCLMQSNDGLIHLYYKRVADNCWGSAHFSTQVQRNQIGFFWQRNDNDLHGMGLLLTATVAGSLMNQCEATFANLSEDKVQLTLVSGSGDIREVWRQLPKNIEALVWILNGKALAGDSEVNYDYQANVTRTRDGSTIDVQALPGRNYPLASILFSAASVSVESDDLELLLPDSNDKLVSVNYLGADPRWVNAPSPASNLISAGPCTLAIGNLNKVDIEGDLTLEAWVSTNVRNIWLFNFGDTQSPYGLNIDADGQLVAARNSGDSQVLAQSLYAVFDAEDLSGASVPKWTHVAASYHTSYGLDLHNRVYVDCGTQLKLNTAQTTVEAWVKLGETDPDKGQVILSQWNPDTKEESFKLSIDKSRKLKCEFVDVRGNHYNLNDSNVTFSADSWRHVAAVYRAPSVRNALYFGNDKGYARVLNDKPMPEEFTLEMWIRPHESSHDRMLFCFGQLQDNGASNTNVFRVELNSDHSIVLHTQAHSEIDTAATVSHYLGDDDCVKFTHVAVVVANLSSGDKAYQVYINGELKAQKSDDQVHTQADGTPLGWVLGGQFKVGTGSGTVDSDHRYSGDMRSVRIWSVARTQKQILDSINLPVTTNELGLIGNWSMNESGNDGGSMSLGGDDFEVKPTIYNEVTGVSATVHGDAEYRTYDMPGSVELLVDEQRVDHKVTKDELQQCDARLYIGRKDSAVDAQYLTGCIDDIRIWKAARMHAQLSYYAHNRIDSAQGMDELAACWQFDEGKGSKVADLTGGNGGTIKGEKNLDAEQTNPYWVPTYMTSHWRLYVNGDEMALADASDVQSVPALYPENYLLLGSDYSKASYINEVRIWSCERSAQQIKGAMYGSVSAKEDNLLAYWPCDDGSSGFFHDSCEDYCDIQTSNIHWHFAFNDGVQDAQLPVPLSLDAPFCINVSNDIKLMGEGYALGDMPTLKVGPSAVESDTLPRTYAGIVNTGNAKAGSLTLYTQKADDSAFEMVYVGQVQTDASLMGYIEGAPPLPSENLTIEAPSNPDKYGGTAKVSVEMGDQVNYYSRSNYKLDVGLKVEMEIASVLEEKADTELTLLGFAGLGLGSADGDVSNKFSFDVGGSFGGRYIGTRNLDMSTSHDQTLEAYGFWEQNLYNFGQFPETERDVQADRMYRPNNMGAAYVLSASADLFAKRSKASGNIVDYQIHPIPHSEDINIIMFPLNPTYVKNGTLDGYIGFDKDIHYAQLDSQQGEKGSYFNYQEALQTEQQIKQNIAEYTNYFNDFWHSDPISSDKAFSKVAAHDSVNTYVWTAEGGLASEEISTTASRRWSAGFNFSLGGSIGFKHSGKTAVGEGILAGLEGSWGITLSGDFEMEMMHANRSQKSLNISADVVGEGFLSKQAIVIGDVDISGLGWDTGDQDSLSPQLTQVLVDAGVVTPINLAYGSDGQATRVGYRYRITELQGQYYLTDIYGKYLVTLSNGGTTTLAGFTPYSDADKGQYRINYQNQDCPGKVRGYRFKTFYLQPSKSNFKALVNADNPNEQIIDPGWLYDPTNINAKAMRNALKRENTEAWRVFHRVTYVNRIPMGLNNIGTDTMPATTLVENKLRPTLSSIKRNTSLIKLLLGQNSSFNSHLGFVAVGSPANADLVDENIDTLLNNYTAIFNRPLEVGERVLLSQKLHVYMTNYLASDLVSL